MGRLFGTDGARGVANTELTCETAMSIGRAAAMVLIEVEHRRPRVLIGKDTRVSSDMLEAALVAGLKLGLTEKEVTPVGLHEIQGEKQ